MRYYEILMTEAADPSIAFGTTIIVTQGGDFNQTRLVFARTPKGWCRVDDYRLAGQTHYGRINYDETIDDKTVDELHAKQKVGLYKEGVRLGDTVHSLIDIAALPIGSTLKATSSIGTRLSVKTGDDAWRAEDGEHAGQITHTMHFEGMVGGRSGWTVRWVS